MSTADGRRTSTADGRSLKQRHDVRGLWIVLGLAIAIVLFRSIVPTLYEQADFDADQATVGLMAKHLSKFRTFPLFLYGENYMLGVQAWLAAPFFWVGGPTVAMLRLPLVLVSAVVAALTIALLVRQGVRPLWAFVAALPLIATTPLLSSALLETGGASVEPFLYVLLLWMLRRKPIAFGALFCFGCLHREFTVVALPAVVVAGWVEGRRWRARDWLGFVAAVAVVWTTVDVLKLHLDTFGPATEGGRSSLVNETRVIASWLTSNPRMYVARLGDLITVGVPVFLGAERYHLFRYSVVSSLDMGSTAAGLLLAVAVALCVWRLVAIARTPAGRGRLRQTAMGAYLFAIPVGVCLLYGLNDGIDPADIPIVRYALFVLFFPVALFAAYVIVDDDRRWRGAMAALVMGWAACALWDNARLVREYRATPPPSEFRGLADYLVAQHIHYGRAQYWDADIVTFLARERVILASTGKVRVGSYQTTVAAHADRAVTIVRQPCTGGVTVASWCVIGP